MTEHVPGWYPGGTPTNILTAILFLGAMGVFAYVAYRLAKILLLGSKEDRFDRIPERLKGVLVFVFGQRRVVRERSGWGHFVIFWGFLLITLGTIEGFIRGVWPGFSYRTLLDPIYLGFLYLPLNLAIDLVSFGVLVALCVALYRRYVQKPLRLESDDAHAKVDATIIIGLIFVLIIFMFLMRGAEVNSRSGPQGGRRSPLSLPGGSWAGPSPRMCNSASRRSSTRFSGGSTTSSFWPS